MKILVNILLFLIMGGVAFTAEDQEPSRSKKVWVEFWQLLANKELPTDNLTPYQEIEKSSSFLACLLLRPQVDLSSDFNLTRIHQQNFTSLMSSLWVQHSSPTTPIVDHYLNTYLERLYLREVTGDNDLILPAATLQKPVVAFLLPWLNKVQGILTFDHIRHLHNQLKIIWALNPSNGRVKYNDVVRALYPLEHLYVHDTKAESKSIEQWMDENKLRKRRLFNGELIYKAYKRATKLRNEYVTSLNHEEGQDLINSWLQDIDLWNKDDIVQLELIKGIANCVAGWNQEDIDKALRKWSGWQHERNRNLIIKLAPGANLELTNFLVAWQKIFPSNENILLTEIPSSQIFWDLLDVYRIYSAPIKPSSNLILKGIFDNFDSFNFEEQKSRLTALIHQIDVFLAKDPLLLQGYIVGEKRLIDILIDRLESSSSEIKSLILINIHKILAHDEFTDIGKYITPKRLLTLYKSLNFVTTSHEYSHLQQILVNLTKDHPGWDLAYRLYEVLGDVQGINEGDNSRRVSEDCLRLPGGGYFILTPDHMNQLWDMETNQFKAINRNHTQQGAGKREVGTLKRESFISDLPELCIKRFPEFPSLEVSVTSFMNQLMGRGGIPSILVHYKTNEPWLLTPRIQLLEHHNSAAIPLHIEEAIILAMLTNPEDGNIHNYGVVEARNRTPYVVGIDNDHGFIPTLGMEVMDGGKKYTLQVKSLLFCLDEMNTLAISNELIQKLKSINAESFLKQWLGRLQPLEEAYLSLFPHKGISLIKDKTVSLPGGTETITLADDSIFTGMMFQESMISCLFDKFQQFHQVLAHVSRPITYLKLLAQMDPPIWKIYKDILQTSTRSSNPMDKARERFMALHGIHYIRVGEKVISCTTMCGLAAALCGEKETRPDALREALQGDKWKVKDGLEYFNPVDETIDENEEIERFKKLRTNAAKVSRLKKMANDNYWQPLSAEQQHVWINLIRQDLIKPPSWKWLYLPALSSLTLSEFASWRMIGIQDLTLDGCLSGAPESLGKIANNSEGLQRLSLRNLDWTGLEIPRNFLGIPLSPDKQRFECLKVLEIENCSNLRRIQLVTPNLHKIKIHNARQLTYEGLASLTRTAPYLLIHRGKPDDIDSYDLHNTGLSNDQVTLLTYDPHFPWEELQSNGRSAIREASQFPEDYQPSIHFYSPLIHRVLKDFSNRESNNRNPTHSSVVALLGSYSVPHSHHESTGNGPYDTGKTVQDPPSYHGFYSRYITVCSHIADHLETLDLSNRHPAFGQFLIENADKMIKLKTLTLGHRDTTSILFGYSNRNSMFPALSALPNLDTLDITIKKWHFKELFFKQVVKMEKIKELKLNIDQTLFEYSDSDISSFSLTPLPNLQILSLKGDRVGYSLPSTLSSAFVTLTNLHTLTLDHIFYNSVKMLTPSFFSPLKNLHTLMFINNPLHFENGVFALANALPALPQLTYLDLSNNDIGQTHDSWSGSTHSCEGVPVLVPALSTLTNLTHLNLANNDLQYDGVQILMSSILASLNKLQALNLNNNGLNEEKAKTLAQQFIDHNGIENIEFFSAYDKDKSKAAFEILKSTFERNRAARIARGEISLQDAPRQEQSYFLTSPNRFNYSRTTPADFCLTPSAHVFLDHLQCIPTVLSLVQNSQRLFPQNTTLYVTGTTGLWFAGFYMREPHTNDFTYQMYDIEQWFNENSIREDQLKAYFGGNRLSDLYHENTPNLIFMLKEKNSTGTENIRQWTCDDAIQNNDETHDPLLKDLIIYLLTNDSVTPTDLRNEQLIIPPFNIT